MCTPALHDSRIQQQTSLTFTCFRYLCGPLLCEELQYWGIPETFIADCCWRTYASFAHEQYIMHEVEAALRQPYDDHDVQSDNDGDSTDVTQMNSIEFDGRTASVCYEFTVPECKLQRGDNTSLEARAASADSSAQTDREQSEQPRDERPYSLSEEATSTGDFAVQINQKNSGGNDDQNKLENNGPTTICHNKSRVVSGRKPNRVLPGNQSAAAARNTSQPGAQEKRSNVGQRLSDVGSQRPNGSNLIASRDRTYCLWSLRATRWMHNIPKFLEYPCSSKPAQVRDAHCFHCMKSFKLTHDESARPVPRLHHFANVKFTVRLQKCC